MAGCFCVGACICFGLSVGAALGYSFCEYCYTPKKVTFARELTCFSASPDIEYHPLILPERVESTA